MTKGLKALFTVTLLLCVLTFSQAEPQELPESLIKALATRTYRMHHYTWHVVRDFWTLLTDEQKKELTALGWGCPRPSFTYDANGVPTAIMDNNAGEDFLWMHKQMIGELNKLAEMNGEKYRVEGWKELPSLKDLKWPVPDPYDIPGDEGFGVYIRMLKSQDFYDNTLKPMEDFFKNPDNLRTMTLGEMGTQIENTIHIWMHMIWSDGSTLGYREKITLDNMLLPIDPKWNDERYYWMGDPFASHIDARFYCLHGWINDRVEDWRKANGLKEIKWKGQWVGGPMPAPCEVNKEAGNGKQSVTKSSSSSSSTMNHADVMEKVCDVFNKAGLGQTRFATNVIIPKKGQ